MSNAFSDSTGGEFIAKLGHELRTPLTAILGYAEILKHRARAHLPDEDYHQLEIIERSGQAMLRLINAVVDWSRLEAGQVKAEPQRFAVGETFQSFADTMVMMAAAKGLRFDLAVAPGGEPHFCTDPHLVGQIFQNLVGNAVKYTEAGGVSVEVAARAGELAFCVADTGPGIPAAHHGRIFHEFQRLNPRDRDGTGLGLAITRGLVTLLGGRIALESAPGEGSRFTVTLPALKAAQPLEPPPALPFPAAAPAAKVAVFDDEPDNRELLKRYLESAGMRVVTFESAVECVMNVLAERPDVVILDMMMPEVDGFEAARRLRAGAGTRHVPIVGLTAMAGGVTGDRAREAGCDFCLTKPLDFRQLTQTLQRCLTAG